MALLLGGEVAQCIVDSGLGYRPDGGVKPLRLGRQMQAVDAAVVAVVAALEPAFGLHAVDQSAGRGLLDLEQIRHLGLCEPWTPVHARNHQPLGPRQPQCTHPAFEDRTHQAGYIGDGVADVVLVIRRHCSPWREIVA